MSPPQDVVEFIVNQPGLLEVCQRMPEVLLEFAPQLAVPGFGGPLEGAIEETYQKSVKGQEHRRGQNDIGGSALTTNGLCPACEDCFALRHPTFGDYNAANVACGYVIGNGAGLGPHTRAYPIFDYLVWILSTKSDWLPRGHHAYLMQGMKEWAQWTWFGTETDSDYVSSDAGALFRWLSTKGRSSGKPSSDAAADLHGRINHSRVLLGLPESTEELVDRFSAEHVIKAWFEYGQRRRVRRARRRSGRPEQRPDLSSRK
jgi:hypothetical protein